jgi:hypothetical protein
MRRLRQSRPSILKPERSPPDDPGRSAEKQKAPFAKGAFCFKAPATQLADSYSAVLAGNYSVVDTPHSASRSRTNSRASRLPAPRHFEACCVNVRPLKPTRRASAAARRSWRPQRAQQADETNRWPTTRASAFQPHTHGARFGSNGRWKREAQPSGWASRRFGRLGRIYASPSKSISTCSFCAVLGFVFALRYHPAAAARTASMTSFVANGFPASTCFRIRRVEWTCAIALLLLKRFDIFISWAARRR